MSENLKVIPLTKKMLKAGVNKNTYWKNPIQPIPKTKALWLINNSRIQDDDYCGVLGYEGEKIISFIFMLPDLMNVGQENIKKVYWMISWWVDDKYKETVLSTYIYNEAVNLANKQILIKSYAENVSVFYEKQPFKVISSRLRYTIFFSLDSSMLIGKFNFLKPFKKIIDTIDRAIGGIVKYLNKLRYIKTTNSLSYDYISKLDDETWKFIKPLCKNDLIHKSREYIDWQIDNSQYLQTPVSSKCYHSHLQTGVSNNIHIHNLKIIKDNKIIGFISYVINYNEFNVKYFLVEDDNLYDLCVDALIENFNKLKTNFIFTDDTKLSNSITNRYVSIYTHKVTKKGLAHNDLNIKSDEYRLLNRDGHFY